MPFFCHFWPFSAIFKRNTVLLYSDFSILGLEKLPWYRPNEYRDPISRPKIWPLAGGGGFRVFRDFVLSSNDVPPPLKTYFAMLRGGETIERPPKKTGAPPAEPLKNRWRWRFRRYLEKNFSRFFDRFFWEQGSPLVFFRKIVKICPKSHFWNL